MMEKDCFGEQCKTCSEFWSCPEHWGDGDQWE